MPELPWIEYRRRGRATRERESQAIEIERESLLFLVDQTSLNL